MSCRALLVSCLALATFVSVAAAAHGAENKMPSAAKVRELMAQHFAGQADLEPGDLISRGTVRPLLEALTKAGWKLDRDAVLNRMLDDSDPVVRAFSSRSGKAFMRKVSGIPLVYDRLDRLARLPGGTELIDTIIKLPDGVKYLEPQPTPGLKNLAQLLPKQANGRTPAGVDFDKPTGKLYTAPAVQIELETMLAAASKKK